MDLVENLNECSDYPCIFELVKQAVELTIGKRRVGLMLGLSELPNYVGALHGIGSNLIVMNKTLLKEVIRASRSKRLVNAYIFHILLHEYVHSLGYVDEHKTRLLTHAISEEVLGEDHPATLMAKHGINSVFPSIETLGHFESKKGISSPIEIVEDFERDNLDYFG